MFTLRGGAPEEEESEKMMMLGGETQSHNYHQPPSQQQPLPYSQSFGEEQIKQELMKSNSFNRQNASARQEFHQSEPPSAYGKKNMISLPGQSEANRASQQQRESAGKPGEVPREKNHFKPRNFHAALKH
jgi:hypothetical protein